MVRWSDGRTGPRRAGGRGGGQLRAALLWEPLCVSSLLPSLISHRLLSLPLSLSSLLPLSLLLFFTSGFCSRSLLSSPHPFISSPLLLSPSALSDNGSPDPHNPGLWRGEKGREGGNDSPLWGPLSLCPLARENGGKLESSGEARERGMEEE